MVILNYALRELYDGKVKISNEEIQRKESEKIESSA